MDPCGDRLHLGKPLFARADVDVRATLDGAARALTILGDGCRDRGAHVQSVWFEGARVAAHEVAWADVANGGVLRFVCGAPAVDYATAPAPPAPRLRAAAAGRGPPPAARGAAAAAVAAVLLLARRSCRQGASAIAAPPPAKEM